MNNFNEGEWKMQLQAYEGYLEDGRFYPSKQPMRKMGKVRAILTILGEPVNDEVTPQEEHYAAWQNRIKAAIAASMDEDLPDFVRSKDMRPPISFVD